MFVVSCLDPFGVLVGDEAGLELVFAGLLARVRQLPKRQVLFQSLFEGHIVAQVLAGLRSGESALRFCPFRQRRKVFFSQELGLAHVVEPIMHSSCTHLPFLRCSLDWLLFNNGLLMLLASFGANNSLLLVQLRCYFIGVNYFQFFDVGFLRLDKP